MTPTIRAARIPEDLPAIRALFTEYIASLGLDLAFQNVDAELSALPGAYAPPRGALLIAALDGGPVGIGALRPLPDGTAEMKRMYLRPIARGTGAGRAMAEALIEVARRVGYTLIRLDTQRDFAPAVALYRSLGFRETARYNDNPLPGALFMALQLSGSAGRDPRGGTAGPCNDGFAP